MKKILKRYYVPFLLVLLFALPYWAAHYFYWRYQNGHLKPMNAGVLIKPPKNISSVAFSGPDSNGPPYFMGEFQGKWLMFSVLLGCCDYKCYHDIFYAHQLVKLLGQSQAIVTGFLVIPKSCPIQPVIDYSNQDYIHMFFGQYTPEQLRNFLDKIDPASRADLLKEKHQVYIIDPQGRLVLYFPGVFVPMDMYNDLKNLTSDGLL